MQDSIEDYIRILKNANEEPIKISKEAQLTAQRKKECDTRAMKIVEFSIEGKLRPEIFLRCLPFINQTHYQDIAEERAISKLCGYPICGKKIPEMPKKQYHISIKSNRVYDITDRKNYCSNVCYKASLHIKKQIDDSPLWLRKQEDLPNYQLLDASDGGLPGVYIDQGIVKPVVEPAFTSVSLFTQASLEDMANNEIGREKPSKVRKEYKKSSKLKSSMQTINESSEQVEEEENSVGRINYVSKIRIGKGERKRYERTISPKTLPVIDESGEKPEPHDTSEASAKENSYFVNEKSSRKKKKGAKSKPIDIEHLVCKAVKEWLTLETYIFVHGESKVKDVLDAKKLGEYFERLSVGEFQRDQLIKYMDICKRLQLQEMADEKFDSALIGNAKLLPLPDYKKLKEENKELTLKVKSFYSGALLEKDISPAKTNKSEAAKNEEGPPAVLPLVDVSSQNALRRKIFLTSLNRSMQQLLEALRVPHFSAVLSDVQSLVRTFNLKADNVIFKPIIWNYIAIVILHILAICDKNIQNILEERQSQTYLELQLSSLPSGIKFINDTVARVHNIDLFLENYVSSK